MFAKFHDNASDTSKDTSRQKLGKIAHFHVLRKTPYLTARGRNAMRQPKFTTMKNKSTWYLQQLEFFSAPNSE